MTNQTPLDKKILELLEKHHIDLPVDPRLASIMIKNYAIMFLEGKLDEQEKGA